MSTCPSCGAGITAGSSLCPHCHVRIAATHTPTHDLDTPTLPGKQHPPGDLHPASSSRFAPGTTLGGRYRIVRRIGRGGMGEVFRAEDLRLGHEVALKFLPAHLADDPRRLAKLHHEVRMARQVSHPNVCRVHDIVEADGQHFVTMELVEGGDLATQLQRFGRPQPDKALELARQISAGLAAAHEQGVLHRDLKPANILLDSRGRARLTDFGLAVLATDSTAGEAAGTPAYMSPEQIGGHDLTPRSDLYTLGLVLYELFTGRPAFTADSLPELLRMQEEEAPVAPREIVDDLDPALDRLILRCLEKDPDQRPASALAVAAALPGGDLLTAALAAGETPSPRLVAASGRRGALSRNKALGLAALTLIALAFSYWFFARQSLGERVGGILPPEVLEHRAREILADLGHAGPAADSAWGFEADPRALSGPESLTPALVRERVACQDRPVLAFYYRQSPAPLAPWRTSLPGQTVGDTVTVEDPPLTEPGMALVRLSPQGRLLELEVIPGAVREAGIGAEPREALIASLLEAAGLAAGATDAVEPAQPPPLPGSTVERWSGPAPSGSGRVLEVEASFIDGIPFRIRTTVAEDLQADGPAASRNLPSSGYADLLMPLYFGAGLILTLINLRARRWDRRGALHLAVVALVLCAASVVLAAHHTFNAAAESRQLFSAMAYGTSRALYTWILYVAMEPFIRRLRPKSLISWSRLLRGRITDPAVGRDVLVGSSVAAGQALAATVWGTFLGWHGTVFPMWSLTTDQRSFTPISALSGLLRYPVVSLGVALSLLLVYAVLHRVLGRAGPAAVIGPWLLLALFFSAAYHGSGMDPVAKLGTAVILATATTFLVIRCGLLAAVVGLSVWFSVGYALLTINPADWYFPPTALTIGFVVALVGFGVWVSTAGEGLLGPASESGAGSAHAR